jgi:hypothetical protein
LAFWPTPFKLTGQYCNPIVTLQKGPPNSVFDLDGSALVIHAKADEAISGQIVQEIERLAQGCVTEGLRTGVRKSAHPCSFFTGVRAYKTL